MPANDYHFVTRWRVIGTAREVADVFADARALARWWPSVYLEVEQLSPGEEGGLGQTARVLTKGWLPYTLSWSYRVSQTRYPHGFTIEAGGDFVGQGVWTFEPEGAWVKLTFDWRIRASKPLIALLSPFFKPIFAANHRWAMARGEESLKLELARRRLREAREKSLVPWPPGPTTRSPVPLILAGTVVILAVVGFARLLRGRRRRRRWW